MGFVQEFREFAARGNVVDLAVGVIIGAAFGRITTSLVEDIFNPLIGRILGRLDFSNYFFNLGAGSYETLDAAKKAGAPVVAYGSFLNALINFLIVAFALFLVVRGINHLRRKEAQTPAAPAAPTILEKLLTEIRDLLQKQTSLEKESGSLP